MVKKALVKSVGIKTVAPKDSCNDKKCPYHGDLSVRGKIFEGVVTSDRMRNTVTVEWPRQIFVKKYERFLKKRSSVKAHNPICIKAKQGDKVKIMECRKLSKTKTFVVLEVLE
ncbi:MAG: 30S ribosomal protein S17 [Nanoarchaeota archaeon]|nr:30S ribosomal protein S17 [Nanoarchaeota archaeon]